MNRTTLFIPFPVSRFAFNFTVGRMKTHFRVIRSLRYRNRIHRFVFNNAQFYFVRVCDLFVSKRTAGSVSAYDAYAIFSAAGVYMAAHSSRQQTRSVLSCAAFHSLPCYKLNYRVIYAVSRLIT